MRQSREAKAETHQAVIAAASRLFRKQGIEGTSVGDVMQAANKTHGGFYRHFDSKEQLLVAALECAFADMLGDVTTGLATAPPAQALALFMAHYTSPRRVADVAGGCPVAALSGDTARSTETVRTGFGRGAQAIIAAIAGALDGPEGGRQQRAAQTFAMAAGAVMIARASDPETAALVLEAVRAHVAP
ncbi:MAG: TetR/AcrR family transcriptional regulator [Novosphingobium sp.]